MFACVLLMIDVCVRWRAVRAQTTSQVLYDRSHATCRRDHQASTNLPMIVVVQILSAFCDDDDDDYYYYYNQIFCVIATSS